MPDAKLFFKYWLPVVVWMLLIFSASTDLMSSQHTSRFLGPMLKWMLPGASARTLGAIQFGIRKCGHLSEYGVLALLLWRARRKPFRGDTRPWSWPDARIALGIATLYAASDEFHQAFVPSRYSTVDDVLIDATGAAVALAMLWVIGRWRKAW